MFHCTAKAFYEALRLLRRANNNVWICKSCEECVPKLNCVRKKKYTEVIMKSQQHITLHVTPSHFFLQLKHGYSTSQRVSWFVLSTDANSIKLHYLEIGKLFWVSTDGPEKLLALGITPMSRDDKCAPTRRLQRTSRPLCHKYTNYGKAVSVWCFMKSN